MLIKMLVTADGFQLSKSVEMHTLYKKGSLDMSEPFLYGVNKIINLLISLLEELLF
ncbi:hypothetical protein SAMN05216455_102147 [Segatella bryantii]|nr:hypothetical protein SAMN05216455_102147 [Segatella bryantii]